MWALSIHGRNILEPGVISEEMKAAVSRFLTELRTLGHRVDAVSLADASQVSFAAAQTPADAGLPVAPEQEATEPADVEAAEAPVTDARPTRSQGVSR
jgi:hypothetical protein